MDRHVKAPGQQWDQEYRELAIVAGLGVGVPVLTEAAALSIWLSPMFGADCQDVPLHNPFSLYWRIFAAHDIAWPAEAWAGLGTVALTTVATVVGSICAWRAACSKCGELRDAAADRKAARKAGAASERPTARKPLPRKGVRREAIDSQAVYMAGGRELDGLSAHAMRAKAAELRVDLRAGDAPGVMIARSVLDGRELYASYEDLHLDVWGPRSGKTTSRVIPAVMDAIGSVVVTSNKRDVVDATRAARKQVGDVHVFDPQSVAGEPCTWYWDPIAWVAGDDGGERAQERAAELAGHFAAGEENDRRDPFFDTEGEDLLSALFLACALDKRPITTAFEWVTTTEDRSPIAILSAGGFDLVSAALEDQYNAPEKQRAGVFSTARKMAACLKYQRIRPWVTPPAKGETPREEFTAADFVAGNRGTLYPLSKEGKGTAGPLVVALCAAVAAAGEVQGSRSRGGRLPVPLLIVLDEAANIVRWRELPKQYSHFGSRGIVIMTILQSWAQGVRCWGPDGMQALLSAANVLTLGAGLKDTGFLRDMSELVGAHYELVTSTSVSHGKGSGRSTSTSRTTEVTLTPSDLSALPKGRALVFTSGHRATLCATVPWFERPYAAQIKDALDELEHSTAAQAQRARLRAVPSWLDEEGETA